MPDDPSSGRAEVEGILRETGALLEGHFLLTSGRHSSAYLEKFQVLQHPCHTHRLCTLIAEHFRPRPFQGKGRQPQVVAGPTTGGIIVAFEVARQLGVRAIFAERETLTEGPALPMEGQGERRVFRRGFSISPAERVLIVDDVLTTGGSLRQVLAEVRRWAGQVVGIGVLVDRSDAPVDLGVPLFSCIQLPLPSYSPEDCPLCQRGEPLVKPGGG